jgi:hypothetical protein
MQELEKPPRIRKLSTDLRGMLLHCQSEKLLMVKVSLAE